VLVTGGTGFVGGWCIAKLLERGHAVRTTVRDLRREADVRAAVAAAGQDERERLTVLEADLASGDGWSEAVAGCAHVLQVASPFPPEQPKDPDELIVPARDGTLRVIDAALDAGVERVILTSSVAAIRGAKASSAAAPLTESDWTDGDSPSFTPYTRSKAIAERSAWERVRAAGAEERLVTICPGAIIGPALSDDLSFSLQAIERLLNGMPAMPRLGFTFVDVRDVAELHVRAMSSRKAAGQRFIAADRFLWIEEVAGVLRDRLGTEAAKVPTRVAPDFVIRLMARFNPALRSITDDLGKRRYLSNDRARTILGWEPITVEDSIVETAERLIELGAAGSATAG
jgi:nucleoside-diphosphate-sugar epimerase